MLYEIGMDEGTLWVYKKRGRIEDLKNLTGQAIIEGSVLEKNGILVITGKRYKIEDITSRYRLMGRWYVKPIDEMKESYFVNEEDIKTMNLIPQNHHNDEMTYGEKWFLNSWRKSEDVEYAKCRNYVSRESTGIKLKSSIWIYKEKK
tara:strand:- start:823 stop:1263 length:441 start_codon:yes stop_codon:yes gene_type:complete